MTSVVAEGTMRAAFLYGPNDVRVDEVAIPVLERPDDVFVGGWEIAGDHLHARCRRGGGRNGRSQAKHVRSDQRTTHSSEPG